MKLEESVSIDQLVDLLSGTTVVAFNTTGGYRRRGSSPALRMPEEINFREPIDFDK